MLVYSPNNVLLVQYLSPNYEITILFDATRQNYNTGVTATDYGAHTLPRRQRTS